MSHGHLRFVMGLLAVLVGFGVMGQTASPALSWDALKNAVYRSAFVKSGEVKLVNGKTEVDDPEGKVTVSLTEFAAFGDLNGDGLNDAVVVLVTWAGGTGSFYDLALLINKQGTAVHVASPALGDRVQVESIGISARQVQVRMVTHKPGDPQCCPTLRVTKTYELRDSRLVEQTATLKK